MIRRSLAALAVATLLAVSGFAAAQSATLTVNATQDSATVTGGESVAVPFEVTLEIDQYSCAQPQELDVGVTGAGGNGVTATPGSANLTFTVGSGVHSSEVMMGYSETQSTDVTVQAPSGTTSGFSQDVTVTATFDGGGGPPECGPSALPATEAEGTVTVNVQADQTGGGPGGDGGTGDGGTDGGDGGMDGNGSGNQSDDENGSPLPAWIVPLGLVSAALVASRISREDAN